MPPSSRTSSEETGRARPFTFTSLGTETEGASDGFCRTISIETVALERSSVSLSSWAVLTAPQAVARQRTESHLRLFISSPEGWGTAQGRAGFVPRNKPSDFSYLCCDADGWSGASMLHWS